MTGIINKTARQIDLRGRSSAGEIVRVTLNPGFNVVEDDDWTVLLENKHTGVLVDSGALVAGTKKTKEEHDLEREAAIADANTLTAPTAPAGVAPVAEGAKDPNEADAKTTRKNTKADKQNADNLDL